MTNTDFLSGVKTAADLATAMMMETQSHNSKNGSPTHNRRSDGSYEISIRLWFHENNQHPTNKSHCIHDIVGKVSKECDGQASLEDVEVGAEFPLPVAKILADRVHFGSVALAGEG